MPVVTLDIEGGGWRNRDIAPGAAIDADKVIHQYSVDVWLTADEATAVTAKELPVHIVHGDSSELVAMNASVFAPCSDTKLVTVDLFKSTAGGAFSTVLSSPIEFDDTVPARTVLPAVIENAGSVDTDIYKIQVTLSGSGTVANGLLVSLVFRDRLA